jgi:scyllo-inositol 2-dehydrogenase (NADP+)
MSRLNVGLIGYGLAGSVFHGPLILSEPRMQLTCVATSRRLSPEYAGVRTETDPMALITADDVDLVVIATPNGSHLPLARAALEAGKHVVVDKPFTIDLADAKTLVSLAAEKGRLLSVFQNRRWDGNFLTVRELLKKGAIGEVRYCEIHYDRFRPVGKQGWRETATPGSGVLYDLGPHILDQALCLFGMPKAVIADIAIQREGVLADDYFHVQLLYDRLKVIAHASCIVLRPGPRFLAHGMTGSILQFGMDQQEPQLVRGLRPGQPGWGEAREVSVRLYNETGDQEIEPKPGAYENFYRTVAAAALDGDVLAVTPRDACDLMALLNAARLSATEGRRVDLS